MLLGGAEQAGGFIAGIHPKPLARLAQVIDDRVVGDPQLLADFLAVQVFIDQPQNLALPRGEALKSVVGVVVLPIHGELACRPVKGCWFTVGLGITPRNRPG